MLLRISCLQLTFYPDDVSLWKTNISRLGTLCHHEKCRGFGLFFGLILFLISPHFGFLNHVLIWNFDIILTILLLFTLVSDLLV